MQIKKVFIYLLWMVACKMYSQEKTSFLKGRITALTENLGGVYVINKSTEKTAITNSEGEFIIEVSVGQTLLFSSIYFKETDKVISKEDLKLTDFVVPLQVAVHQLREVIINGNSQINARNLGIIAANTKNYTPAERKLRTASNLDPTATVGSMAGGSISLDPLLNLISGRTAMLKKEVEVEKKEYFIRKLEAQFDTNYLKNKLHIPAAYTKGFLFFAVERNEFTRVLKTQNRTATEFLLGILATEYLQTLPKEENKELEKK